MSFKYTPATLKKLEGLFDEARYTVRYEKGNFNSGYCLLEQRRMVIVNRFLNIEGRINALLEILPTIEVVTGELSGEGQKWYGQLMAELSSRSSGEEETGDSVDTPQLEL